MRLSLKNRAEESDFRRLKFSARNSFLKSVSMVFINVSLAGGYDSVFSSVVGFTTVNGSLTISRGKVTIDRIIIK